MRYAFISDIHSNWEALKEVLDYCRREKIDRTFCIGDIIGYGSNPRECLDAIRKGRIQSVAGNHDWAVSGRLDPSYFTEDGRAAVMWTRNNVRLDDIEFINGLPVTWAGENFMMVHATPNKPEQFHYVDNIEEAREAFGCFNQQICFIGHTHVPKIFIEHDQKIYMMPNTEIELNDQDRYIVNIGSIGQPRDGNPLSSFCVFDSRTKNLQIKRVQYDYKITQNKIMKAGLPPDLASRLAVGF